MLIAWRAVSEVNVLCTASVPTSSVMFSEDLMIWSSDGLMMFLSWVTSDWVFCVIWMILT